MDISAFNTMASIYRKQKSESQHAQPVVLICVLGVDREKHPRCKRQNYNFMDNHEEVMGLFNTDFSHGSFLYHLYRNRKYASTIEIFDSILTSKAIVVFNDVFLVLCYGFCSRWLPQGFIFALAAAHSLHNPFWLAALTQFPMGSKSTDSHMPPDQKKPGSCRLGIKLGGITRVGLNCMMIQNLSHQRSL